MEEFKKNKYLDFEDLELSILVRSLKNCFDKQQNTFVYICRDVYRIWSYCKGKYFQIKNSNDWCNSYQVLAKFGFDKKAVSRYKQCYEKYIVDKKLTLALYSQFVDFSPSKLFEMLPLSQETLFEAVQKGILVPDMTVKQIRELVKSIMNNGVDKAEKVVEDTAIINEDEIPLAYNPNEKYEYSYFESMSKNQLLNIVWELQKAYQKLKNKGDKKNDKQSNK